MVEWIKLGALSFLLSTILTAVMFLPIFLISHWMLRQRAVPRASRGHARSPYNTKNLGRFPPRLWRRFRAVPVQRFHDRDARVHDEIAANNLVSSSGPVQSVKLYWVPHHLCSFVLHLLQAKRPTMVGFRFCVA